ncbi:MAG: hypothetical protein J5595_03210 [Bacteroidales bacterium]|jgi:hypothetical protein|nr:hypothetical protein [Bacteroidales bacterium]
MRKSQLISFVEDKFDILETIFILALLVSAILMMNTISYSLYGIQGSLILLALLYFLMALRPFEGKVAGLRIVVRRVVYISFVLGCLTTMSVFSFDEGVDVHKLIIATLVFLAISIVALLLLRFKMNVKERTMGLFVRCGIFTAVLLWLWMMY